MDTVRPEPVELTDHAADQIADLAKVSADHRRAFCAALPSLFDLAREEHSWDVSTAPRRDAVERQFAAVEKAATVLRVCLDKLDDDAREVLGIYALRNYFFGGAVAADSNLHHQVMDLVAGGLGPQGRLHVAFFSKIVDEIRLAATTREWPSGTQGGAPSKRVEAPGNWRVSAFDRFVFNLERHILDCGGRTQLDKNYGTGTLIQILNVAVPYLPVEFIPPGIVVGDETGKFRGLSRVYRMKKQAGSTGQKPPRKL